MYFSTPHQAMEAYVARLVAMYKSKRTYKPLLKQKPVVLAVVRSDKGYIVQYENLVSDTSPGRKQAALVFVKQESEIRAAFDSLYLDTFKLMSAGYTEQVFCSLTGVRFTEDLSAPDLVLNPNRTYEGLLASIYVEDRPPEHRLYVESKGEMVVSEDWGNVILESEPLSDLIR